MSEDVQVPPGPVTRAIRRVIEPFVFWVGRGGDDPEDDLRRQGWRDTGVVDPVHGRLYAPPSRYSSWLRP
jgi:hypothetical protein